MNRRAANFTQGTLGFNANESGYDFASFVLGYPDNSQTPQGYPAVNMRSTRFGIFFTDDWKVTPKLTLDYGVRVVHMRPQYDSYGYSSNFLPELWSAAQAPRLYVAGCATNVYPCTAANRRACPSAASTGRA